MLRFLEIIWLFIGIFGIAFTGYSLLDDRYERYDTIWFLVISVVAFGMFFLRRTQRRRMKGN